MAQTTPAGFSSVPHVHFMLEEQRVGGRFGEDGAAASLVLNRLMVIRVPDPELISLRAIVKDAYLNR